MIPETMLQGADTVPTPMPSLSAQAPAASVGERPLDLVLLGAVLLLVGIGTVEIYSASAVYALRDHGSATHFLVRQLFYVGLGGAGLVLFAHLDYGLLRRFCLPLLGVAVLLLVVVLFIGGRINGARRWLLLGPLTFQPVEVAKLALVVYLAHSLSRKQERVKFFAVGFLPHMLVCGLMVALCLKQPDLGSSLILGATTITLLFVAGTKISYILVAVLAAAPVVYTAVVGTAWRMRRILAYIDPWQFREGVGYQITESLISLGSGGLFGVGLGDGKQKLLYLPEAHSDFIMANIGEELGFVGFALVLALFAVVVWRGVRAALGARDAFGTYLGFGLTMIFAFQVLVNTGVVLGALPAKGLTLPLVSYGGTSLVVSLCFIGILLNIGRRRPLPAPSLSPRLENDLRNRRRRLRVQVEVG